MSYSQAACHCEEPRQAGTLFKCWRGLLTPTPSPFDTIWPGVSAGLLFLSSNLVRALTIQPECLMRYRQHTLSDQQGLLTATSSNNLLWIFLTAVWLVRIEQQRDIVTFSQRLRSP